MFQTEAVGTFRWNHSGSFLVIILKVGSAHGQARGFPPTKEYLAIMKGNKAKTVQPQLTDRSEEIREKEARKAQLEEELNALRDKMVEQRNLEKELRKLKEEQQKYEEMKRIEEQRAILDEKIGKLLADGMSAEEILAKLK